MSGAQAWDTARAAALARAAYRYVARVYPKDGPWEPIRVADRAVLEAQEVEDWPAYVEALRELMRVARRGAAELARKRAA